MKRLILLLALLPIPQTVLAGEHRAIVKVEAVSERPFPGRPIENVLHTYQPGDAVETISQDACALAACQVALPGGGNAWVPSYKITDRSNLAAEQENYRNTPWSDMSDSQVYLWADAERRPLVAYICAIVLAGGEPKLKKKVEPLCEKVRASREVREASAEAAEALETMSKEERQKMLNGGAPIGAPREAVYIAWGKPRDTKRTITKGMVAEQFIYDERVAYTENGILTMIQE